MVVDIKQFKKYKVIKPILKGWSDDQKYYLEAENGQKLLLRLSDISLYEKKLEEFKNLKRLSKSDINMSKPIEFGTCDENKKVYSLLTWIEGDDAIQMLPKLDEKIQYELGYKAGQILKKIHTLKPTMRIQPWNKTIDIKIKKTIDFYNNCGLRFKNDEIIINYILDNKKHLKDRPITFQHGDYHLGNMIITKEGDLGIIDFNRFSYGDPWEEYDRFVFTWKESDSFARGQIEGCFNNDIPEEFFKVMSVYNAKNLIASIPWSLNFGEEDLRIAIENANLVYETYKGFTSCIPTWYRRVK